MITPETSHKKRYSSYKKGAPKKVFTTIWKNIFILEHSSQPSGGLQGIYFIINLPPQANKKGF
jgi:hypothetical protein